MWPWGHLAAGYLLYRVVVRRAPAQPLPALALAVGTQLPDLIDKPLAWTVQLLPNGRSLGHSLLVAGPLLAALMLSTDGRRRRVAVALASGYLTHLATDALYPVLDGDLYFVGFLGWPAIPPIDYPTVHEGIVSHFLQFTLTPRSGFEILLFAIAALVWVADGAPGLRLVGQTVKERVGRARQFVGV